MSVPPQAGMPVPPERRQPAARQTIAGRNRPRDTRPPMKQLASEALMNDPRVAEARRLMLLALTDQQRRLTGVRAADPERTQSHEQALREFAEIRGGALYYPYLGSGIGRGCLVELADGSVKYDMISGIGVHGLGHSHPALAAALFDAALADTVMQGNLQQNTDSLEISRLLIELAGRGGSRLSHCFLSSSGAMANENALKLV